MKRALIATVVGSLVLLAVMHGFHLLTPAAAQQRGVFPPGNSPPPPPPDSLTELSDRLEAISQRVLPSVVSVQALKQVKNAGPSNSPPKSIEEVGSGVIIKLPGRPEFYVLTNNHVIKETSLAQITVVVKEGMILRPSKVWADRETDVAFMKLDGALDLKAATLGNSDTARVGRLVLAMGNPFGLGWSVSHGVISARERDQVMLGNQIRLKDFLQTDAAINPGSSGGPLVDMNGEVIGINTAIASPSGSNAGVAFCIPINMAKHVMAQLLETNGTIRRGYLGAELAKAIEPQEALRLGRNRVTGALVVNVLPNTPARNAGLRPEDIVLALNNIPIRSENHFINLISSLPPGQRILLQVWRNNAPINLEATVGARL